jgi:hypothetical protein
MTDKTQKSEKNLEDIVKLPQTITIAGVDYPVS